MKGYFFLSCFAHAALLAGLLTLGAILAKPRTDYYSVDLFSPMPAGSAAAQLPPPPAAAPVPAPKASAPPPPAPEEKPVPKEAIRMPTKAAAHATKKPAKPKSAKPKSMAAFQAAMRALENQGAQGPAAEAKGASQAASGSGVVGEAGPTFPYPWYLKIIADKLDKQWHPPQEFASDTVCQIAFIIRRDGQVTDASIEKPSGDNVFDQLAVRAVDAANPLPGLPSGYPEDTLRVHMKFVGKGS